MQVRGIFRRLGWRVWSDWPEQAYQHGRYQQRLSAVQEHLAECVDPASPGPLRILSMCAGDGRDVIGVLASHRRRNDVSAWLVELDCQSVAHGVKQATHAGLAHTVNFIHADATDFVTYQRLAPADIVLVCGVWGHVPAHERASLVQALASLCKPGGTVIWTRGVSPGMTRLQDIQSLFAGSPWEEVRVSFTSDQKWAVATYRYLGRAQALPKSGQIFHFQRNAG